MRAVIQRVQYAKLFIDGKLFSEINRGFLIYLGVKKGDELSDADYVIKKISALRIFEDENGKTNKSLKDVGGSVLLVSQFTLLASLKGGNRPDFMEAELPIKAKPMYEYVCNGVENNGITVKRGVFGADMQIESVNDGPFTVILESK